MMKTGNGVDNKVAILNALSYFENCRFAREHGKLLDIQLELVLPLVNRLTDQPAKIF